jgi:ADP-ribose pyrophosphatase YjhB (NUDIX family)
VRDGAVLAVQHQKAGRRYFMLPGGGVDAGERLAEGLAREFAEELGVVARPGRLLLACDTIAPDRSRHIVHLVFAVEIEGEPRATGADERVVGPAWLSRERLGEVTFYPDILEWLKGALEAGPRGADVLAPEWR